MTRKPLLSARFPLPLSPCPPGAAAPPFETPATIAYMIDLSSGAVLYAKDADRRMPPASMAKMMTTHVAFDLIKQRRAQARPDVHGASRDLAALARPGGGIDDVPLAGRAGQRRATCCTASSPCRATTPPSCSPSAFPGTEPAFVALMNRQSQAMGLANSQLGQSGRLARRRRHLHHRARPRHARRRARSATIPQLYREYYGMREFTWGRTMGVEPADHPGQPQPAARPRRRAPTASRPAIPRRRATASPARPSRTAGGIVMVVAGLSSFNQRIEESVRFMDWGFSAWQSQPLLAPGPADRRGAGPARRRIDASAWSRRANIAVTYPAGHAARIMRAKIVYQGPVKAPIAQGQHIADLVVDHRRHAAPDHAAGRRADGRRGGLLRPHLARAEEPRSAWRERGGRFITLEGGEGAGKSTQAQGAGRGAARARPRRRRDPRARRQPGRRGDPQRCCSTARSTAGRPKPRRCCSPPPAPTMSRGRSGRRWTRAHGCSATASSTARSPIRAAPAASASTRSARCTRSAAAASCPTGRLLLELPIDEADARAVARDAAAPTGSAARGADYHRRRRRGLSRARRGEPERFRVDRRRGGRRTR